MAALINGTAGHALDYDDAHTTMGGHPTVPVLPAALAVAEEQGSTGAELLAAFLVGVEIESRVGALFAGGTYGKGWHCTSTHGVFGAAAATCHLLGADAETFGRAFGLAGSQASGLKVNFGTMTKPFHAGHAAERGALAARLALRGFSANANVVEGRQGLAEATWEGPEALRWDRFDAMDDRWLIEETLFKYHAACYLTHSTIESIHRIKAESGVDIVTSDELREARLVVNPAILDVCGIPRPSTGLEAKFSLTATASMALLGLDTSSIETFTDETLTDSRLQELIPRIQVDVDEAVTSAQARVTLDTGSGGAEAFSDMGIPAEDLDRPGREAEREVPSSRQPLCGRPFRARTKGARGGRAPPSERPRGRFVKEPTTTAFGGPHPFDESFLPLLDEAFAKHAEKECLRFGDQVFTYEEVGALSAQCTHRLANEGFEPGDKGAVYSLNSAVSFIAALGLLRAGGVWIPVNPRNAAADNVEILVRFGCDALFSQSAFSEPIAETVSRLEAVKANVSLDGEGLSEWLGEQPTTAPQVERQGTDTLTIPMTGGTTGLPKGVMLSHRNLRAINHAMTTRYGEREAVILCAAPMTHVGGRITLTSLSAGARFVILEKVDPQIILKVIEQERITDFFLPPTAIYSLLDQPNLGDFDLSSLRTLSYGSAPMAVERIKDGIEKLGPILRGGYGQTECPMFISTLSQEEHFQDQQLGGEIVGDEILRTVGRSTLISEIAIMNDDGELLPPGERGEVVVRGPMVSEGYYEAPEETARIRRNGWHLTGDMSACSTSRAISPSSTARRT